MSYVIGGFGLKGSYLLGPDRTDGTWHILIDNPWRTNLQMSV